MSEKSLISDVANHCKFFAPTATQLLTSPVRTKTIEREERTCVVINHNIFIYTSGPLHCQEEIFRLSCIVIDQELRVHRVDAVRQTRAGPLNHNCMDIYIVDLRVYTGEIVITLISYVGERENPII